MKRFLCLCLTVCTVGCASVDVLRLDPTPRPQTKANAIRVFLDEPTTHYEAIALVVVSDKGNGWNLERLSARLRDEAATLGGNGVIVGRESGNAGTYFMPIGTASVAIPITVNKLVGKVILLEP